MCKSVVRDFAFIVPKWTFVLKQNIMILFHISPGVPRPFPRLGGCKSLYYR